MQFFTALVVTSCTRLQNTSKFTHIIPLVFLLVFWPFKFNNCFAFRTRWCSIVCHIYVGNRSRSQFHWHHIANHGCYISNPKHSVVSKIVGERRNRKIYHYNHTIVNWVVNREVYDKIGSIGSSAIVGLVSSKTVISPNACIVLHGWPAQDSVSDRI